MAILPEELVGSIYPFTRLHRRQVEAFIRLCDIKEYRPGDIVYREDALPDNFYLLIKGRLVALTPQGKGYSEIELIKRGTSFGIISLFNDEPHSVCVKAIENSVVLQIDKEKFKKFLGRNHALFLDFSKILSERVRRRVDRPKKIFKSKRVGIYSLSCGIGKTTYMANLSLRLREHTGQKIIVLELSFEDSFNLPRCFMKDCRKVLLAREFKEESLSEYVNQGRVSWLCVRLDRSSSLDEIFALLNCLSEEYNFIFYELPRMDEHILAPLAAHADSIHLLTSLADEEEKSIESMAGLLGKDSFERVRLLAYSAFASGRAADFKYPVYQMIPDFTDPAYSSVLGKISRELCEKTLGLVLGSGAAFGFAHIGVIKVLQENNIPVDIICGSSMGALIGALWALGHPINEIERSSVDFGKRIRKASLGALSVPVKGFLSSRKFEGMLKDIFADKTFADLKYPLRVVAFDFLNRQSKIFSEGELYKIVAASCSMPGIFEPIHIKDGIFLDGGILNPLPAEFVLDYAKKIIAVNITPSRDEIFRDYRSRRGGVSFNIFDFIFGSIETMQRKFISETLSVSDIVIHPDLSGLRWVEFEKVSEFVKRGETAARDKLEDIIKLARV